MGTRILMSYLHYLAYGSNLNPLRLLERVPSSRFIAVVPMPGRSVAFHKRSTDGSGKCNLVESSHAAQAYGVIYEFFVKDKAGLDAAEGLGHGYGEALLSFVLNKITYQPYAYVASDSYIDPALKPYHWYKALVLSGARYHNLPEEYVAELESVQSIPDPDYSRNARHEALLARMAEF